MTVCSVHESMGKRHLKAARDLEDDFKMLCPMCFMLSVTLQSPLLFADRLRGTISLHSFYPLLRR